MVITILVIIYLNESGIIHDFTESMKSYISIYIRKIRKYPVAMLVRTIGAIFISFISIVFIIALIAIAP